MENTVTHTGQMTGMHTIPAEWRAVHRWMATRTIPVGYRAVHRWMATRTIPAGYQVVRRLEITAMKKVTKAAEIAEGIIGLAMVVVIIRIQLES